MNSMRHFFPFVLAFLLLFSSCLPAAAHPIITPNLSAAPTATVTLLPTQTVTPIPIPENLIAQKDLLEQNGFVFGESEITHQDQTGRVWEVAKFNPDGSAIIRNLAEDYKGVDASLSAEEVSNLSVELLNAGHNPIIVVKNETTGKVTKFFLAHTEESTNTEAGWVLPLELALDAKNPTKADAAAFHTRHVYYSAMLGKGSEPWPDDFPTSKFYITADSQYIDYFKDKLDLIQLRMRSFDTEGNPAPRTGRTLGFVDLDTPEGKILIHLREYKISQAGTGFVLNTGYSGPIFTLSNFYEVVVNEYNEILIYQSIGNNIDFQRGGKQSMLGVRYLYDHDLENRPWYLFPEEVQFLRTIDKNDVINGVVWMYEGENNGWGHDITDSETLKELENEILHPVF